MAKKSMDEVKQLIDMGKEKGFLTYDEVNDLLPPDMVSSEQIDDVMSMFGEMEIEVVDSAQKVKIPKVNLDLDEGEELEGEQEDVEFEPGALGRTHRSGQNVFAGNGFRFPVDQRRRSGDCKENRRG